LLAVGVLASAAQAEARLKSTRGQCLAACGQAVSDSCGWITKRGKFNRCRAKLINQCKRFGTDVMCPAQVAPPPPSSPTTPTTTTTTVPANLPACYRNPSGGDQCLAMCNGGSCVIPCSQCRPEDMPSVTTTTTPYYPPTTTTLPYVYPTTTTLPYFPT